MVKDIKPLLRYALDRINNIAGYEVLNNSKERTQILLYDLAELIAYILDQLDEEEE